MSGGGLSATRRVDVIVVGAGPAGSASAALAAATGARVLLIEKRPFPRSKVCGEFVSAEGRQVLARLGVLKGLLDAGGSSLSRCRITSPGGTPLDARLPALEGSGPEGLGISRERMDLALLEHAVSEGVELLQPASVVEPLLEDGRVVGVKVRREGHEESWRASIVVAADGRRSILGRALHPRLGDPSRSGPDSWFGLKTHVDGSDARIGDRVDLHLFHRGYAGLARIEESRLNLCLMTTADTLRAADKDRDTLIERHALSNPAFGDAIGSYRRVGPWHAIGPLRFAPRRPSAAGALFVGDAAGTIDPFSGEGMSNALLAAELVQPAIAAAVTAGQLPESAARDYAAAWRTRFTPVTRRVRRLGRLLERPRIAGPLLRAIRVGGAPLTPRLVAWTRTGNAPE